MRKKTLTAMIAVLSVVILIFLTPVCAFATGENEDEATKTVSIEQLYKNPEGRLMSVAHRGDVQKYPENSLEGIISAVAMGVDIIEIDVKKTSDGVLILMADDDFSRTCVDPSGKTITAQVSETENWEVIAMKLREGTGGAASAPTVYAPPSLESVIKAVSGKALLLINCDKKIRDDVYSFAVSKSALNMIIFRVQGEKSSLSSWIESKGVAAPMTMGGYDGNIVFSARSYVKKTLKYGSQATVLSVKNPYGVIFNKSVLKLFDEKGRAVADMTDSALCGGREDNETGWNDLTARGYSVIITDYPERLVSYIKATQAEQDALVQKVKAAEAIDLSRYSSSSIEALSNQIKISEKMLETSFSKQSLNQQYFALEDAIQSLEVRTGNDKGDGKTVTGGRITAAIIISVVFIFSQLWVYSKSIKRPKGSK